MQNKKIPDDMVEVRIAVAVDADGMWACAGTGYIVSDLYYEQLAQRPLMHNRISWVRAIVPKFVKPVDIDGEVTE